MRPWSLLVAALALAGCAQMPPPAVPSPTTWLRDALFSPVPQRTTADEVLALSEPMRRYLESIATPVRQKGARQALIESLYAKGQLRLEYEASRTRTAAEAFDGRAGNCLSLVLMTAAFARALDVPVTFQLVQTPETWSRVNGLDVSSRHVNLTLGTRLADRRGPSTTATMLTIDFLPQADLTGQRARRISESTVLAMYFNNRAAEALADGRLDEAYGYASDALRTEPGYLAAHNTLAVLYLRRSDAPSARRVLESVLQREPENSVALGNLVRALEALDEPALASAAARRLAAIEPRPPFHYFDLGLAALQRGDLRTARDSFQKELARDADYHEFHFWLGVTLQRLGDSAGARRHMALAVEGSTTRTDRDLYAAKLDWLRTHPAH